MPLRYVLVTMHRGEERRDVETVLHELDVRPPDGSRLLGSLSGGNPQKALIGKWLLRRPRILVLDSPTIGIDPTAREEIFSLLRGLATGHVRECQHRGAASTRKAHRRERVGGLPRLGYANDQRVFF